MVNKTIPSQDLRKAKLLADPTCSHCGLTKTVADFPPVGVDYWCLKCRNKNALRYYHDRRASLSPSELQALKADVNKRQIQRRIERLAKMSPEELERMREKVNREGVVRRNAMRDKVYQAYGGYRCNCCGEIEAKFLSIDHVNNDGAKHRRENGHKTGEQMYRWLILNGFPDNFQVLCMNCQWGKRNNRGVCPHRLGKV